jgi:hypothetical protein
MVFRIITKIVASQTLIQFLYIVYKPNMSVRRHFYKLEIRGLQCKVQKDAKIALWYLNLIMNYDRNLEC